MGIKDLNRFLLTRCSKASIQKQLSLSELRGKTLVIDASISIYKFIESNALLENMYLFISILRDYEIIPVFIFDGKPPPEKKELLYQRRLKKKEAEHLYNDLKEKALTAPDECAEDIHNQLESLQKQFLRMNDTHINTTKQLLAAYGIEYYVASGEADELCAQLVIANKAWACISDDMDMFVYGCTRVIRHISLLNKTCVFYDMKSILSDLQMNMTTFRQIMVLSGTDYHINKSYNLYDIIDWYNEYKKESLQMDFYEWLVIHYQIQNMDVFNKIISMFTLNTDSIINPLLNIDTVFKTSEKKNTELFQLLQKEGFLSEII
jgi:hypothetical protein